MSNFKDKPIKYILKGVTCHSGTLNGGHYTAYINTDINNSIDGYIAPVINRNWYYISDSYVKKVDQSDVLKCQAYMLYYERIFI